MHLSVTSTSTICAIGKCISFSEGENGKVKTIFLAFMEFLEDLEDQIFKLNFLFLERDHLFGIILKTKILLKSNYSEKEKHLIHNKLKFFSFI